MAATSNPLDAIETLRQEIKTLETEIASLNARIKELLDQQIIHPERWNLLQKEILESRRLTLEKERQITSIRNFIFEKEHLSTELITRQHLTHKRGPSGPPLEESDSKSSRSTSSYSISDALHGKPIRDLIEGAQHVDAHAFFLFRFTHPVQHLFQTAFSSTLGLLSNTHPSEETIQKHWDDFAQALFNKHDELPSSQREPRALSYFNTSHKSVFSAAKYRPDISLCEAQVKDINRVMATNIVAFGELKRDASCFNDPMIIHQLAKYASLYFKETPNISLKCFLATHLAIRGYEFRKTTDSIVLPLMTHIYDLQWYQPGLVFFTSS